MTTDVLFEQLETITHDNIHYLENAVAPLSMDQRAWKPQLDVWNINEILSHLLEYANYYHSTFLKKIDTTIFRDSKEDFISSPLGKSLWRGIKLGNAKNIKRKMKSPKMYNPLFVPSIVSEQVVSDFLKSQHTLLTIFERAKTINIRKTKVRLAVANVIKIRMGDAFLFVVYHNQRHLQQIANLLMHPKFPLT